MEDRIKEIITRTCPHRARDAQISKTGRKGKKRRLAIEQLGGFGGEASVYALWVYTSSGDI